MSSETQIWTSIDYTQPGKQIGFLGVPQSYNLAGWATEYIPIAVIANGSGPTALLFGGNHGDEYEGPVTLNNLVRAVDPAQVNGRIIIVPTLNRPAAEAGTRLSPRDGMNMNRAFPGDANGSITSVIAHYVTHHLFPLADIVIDIHSGGRSLHFLPSVNMHEVENPTQMQDMLAAGVAWGAPYVFVYRDVGGQGLLPGLAEKLGKVTLGTEMGSAGMFTPEILRITSQGVYNVLRLHGILGGDVEAPPQPPQIVGATEQADYIMAPCSGIFEPFIDLGDSIQAGQMAGQLHSLEQPFGDPTPVVAATDGMVMGRRAFPLTRQGDCVVTVVRPFAMP
ncbi:MAG: succinylglutamate desuccinylase/aspartoacylase family protein [Litorilinea sp.]